MIPVTPSTIIGCCFLFAVAIAGVQTYRLQAEKADHDLLKSAVAASNKLAAMQALQDKKAQERADENFAAASKRAAAVVVRANPGRIKPAPAPVASGGERAAECLSRRDVDGIVADFATQHAEGLGDVVTAVSQRHAAQATRIAREGEAVAAGYRSCRGWAVDVGGSATPETPAR